MRNTSPQRLAPGLRLREAGQRLGHAVQGRDSALGVGGDDGIADALQGDREMLTLDGKRLLGLLDLLVLARIADRQAANAGDGQREPEIAVEVVGGGDPLDLHHAKQPPECLIGSRKPVSPTR